MQGMIRTLFFAYLVVIYRYRSLFPIRRMSSHDTYAEKVEKTTSIQQTTNDTNMTPI
jgi:hypothetical protein